ncbi:MAG: heat-shock protein [Alphaproteobacteria bacterium]|nr:MAG: heat-shock protein [Alphaproteobacteria bacterium]
MRAFDFSPLLRSTIGFENLNRLVDMASRLDTAETSYPPYNIEKLSEDDYRISMAVAGFKRDELDIVVQENALLIRGQAAEADEDKSYLHRGIAKRAFERRFQLADSIKVVGASLVDGLLNVDLKREVPEHKKPRQIEIQSPAYSTKPVAAKSAA